MSRSNGLRGPEHSRNAGTDLTARTRARCVSLLSTTMTHALLLRLFLSPSFFSVHVSLRYLMLYSDNIGITYYLTRRLREFTIDELRDIWGFIW